MSEYEFHPIAAIFPMVEPDELDALAADIKQHGLKEPVWLWEGKILDGRNRYVACGKAGVSPEFCEFNGNAIAAVDFVWSLNRRRRHLSSSQAAASEVVREKLVAEYSEAIASIRSDAKRREQSGKGSDGSGGRGKKKNPVEQIPQGFESGKTRSVRAKSAGTNPRYIQDAEKLSKENPDLFEQVHKGEKTITQAKREIKEAKRESRREKNRAKVKSAGGKIPSDATFATILMDPPWDWGDEGDCDQLGRARPDYATMTIDQICELPVGKLADVDCHLYMWITNRSLPKGFSLIESWGFRYVTCLTWCKPSFGMGNYFRGSTEHILFAVKGSQQLKRKDAGTWYSWPRGEGGHSSKPSEIYELIESCSPGPFLEMFSRSGRDGWSQWGENA